MNEWLEKKSERIALFRTYTSQKNLKNFYSLYPNKSNEYNREQIHAQENIPIYYTGIKKFEPLNNHLILFLDLFKEKIRGMLKVKEKLDRGVGHFESKEDFLDNERFYFLGCMQIFPLLDRFGRIMIDLANYLMYNSYKYFEDNIFNFRKNVYDESLRFMNIHDRRETVDKNRLKHFQTLVQFSCAKIENDENVQNINNNNINSNTPNNINNNSGLNNNTLLNSHKGKNDFKKRVQSANPKFKVNFQESKTKNKNSGNKDLNSANIITAKTKNELLPDIYDISGTQNSEGPKITKILKKNLHKQDNKQNGSIY
jgi:hypothetical protein